MQSAGTSAILLFSWVTHGPLLVACPPHLLVLPCGILFQNRDKLIGLRFEVILNGGKLNGDQLNGYEMNSDL